jgi:hypothetical protein
MIAQKILIDFSWVITLRLLNYDIYHVQGCK